MTDRLLNISNNLRERVERNPGDLVLYHFRKLCAYSFITANSLGEFMRKPTNELIPENIGEDDKQSIIASISYTESLIIGSMRSIATDKEKRKYRL